MIYENLREKCIYEEVGNSLDFREGHSFFNYLIDIQWKCIKDERVLHEECANKVMEDLDLPVEKIKKCIKDSFIISGDQESYNWVLGVDREVANRNGVTKSPSLTVNGHPYYGEFKAEPMFEAICKGFHPLHKPNACMTTIEAMARIEALEDSIQQAINAEAEAEANRKGFAHHHAFLLIVLVVVLNVLLILHCIKKHRKKDQETMSSSVQMHVD